MVSLLLFRGCLVLLYHPMISLHYLMHHYVQMETERENQNVLHYLLQLLIKNILAIFRQKRTVRHTLPLTNDAKPAVAKNLGSLLDNQPPATKKARSKKTSKKTKNCQTGVICAETVATNLDTTPCIICGKRYDQLRADT